MSKKLVAASFRAVMRVFTTPFLSFGRFASMGLPFTLAATAAGAAFIWFVLGP